ncbi:ABC transporter permease subunit [Candidatus Acetothermia bacterium]|nr:ABC transporter permease subunit [Candidatus Acetothermia bacterium]MBI3642765.1 ABC transporter permease subunit [Candidatus Acetothermia bacterium]
MIKNLLGYLLSVILLLLIWQGVSSLLVYAYQDPQDARIVRLVPSPLTVLAFMINHWEELGKHLLGTSFRLITSIILSLALAIPLGLYIGHANWARRYLTPFVYSIYPIPKVVFWPVIFLLFQIGQATEDIAKITFIVLVVFFQLLVSIRDAAENIPKEYVVTALAAGVKPFRIYTNVILPGSLPAIFSSLRVSLGLGIFAVYVSETTFAFGTPEYGGLGWFIFKSGILNINGDYAAIVAIAALGLTLYVLIEFLEHWLCRWKYVGHEIQR